MSAVTDAPGLTDAPAIAARRTRAIGLSLPDAARIFWRYPSPWVLAGIATTYVTARVALGGWRWADLGIAVALVALQPFVEWVIHTSLLHWKPRTVLGRRIDPLVARKHREHHRDPKRLDVVFIPLPTIFRSLVGNATVWFVFAPTAPFALTGLATGALLGFVYEWVHYLIHSDYKPRRWAFRNVWRNHRLHHYKSERYWFGVTNALGDHVLRTHPDRNAVPTSPTCKELLARP